MVLVVMGIRSVGVALLMFVSGAAFGADARLTIETKPAGNFNYAWITFLTEGPAGWLAKDDDAQIQGKTLRFIFYSGPEEAPSTYRIEEISFGTERCCRALRSARQFQLREKMSGAFGPPDARNANEFEFIRWRNASAVEIKYFGRPYAITDLDRRVITVVPMKK
jgi:hypothetical protein